MAEAEALTVAPLLDRQRALKQTTQFETPVAATVAEVIQAMGMARQDRAVVLSFRFLRRECRSAGRQRRPYCHYCICARV